MRFLDVQDLAEVGRFFWESGHPVAQGIALAGALCYMVFEFIKED